MSRYVVTGGAGFIGSHIVEALLERGDSVVVIDNLQTGSLENLPMRHNLKLVVGHIEGNILYSDAWDVAVANGPVDGVFHCAAQARIQPSIENPIITHTANTIGTFATLEQMRRLSIKNIVFSSSSSIYGHNECVENGPIDCMNPYAVSKYTGEQHCKTWGKLYKINNVCLRYFNVYGERAYIETEYAPIPGLFYRQLLKEQGKITIVGTGNQRRDFTHVEDVVQANLMAMDQAGESGINGETFNIGTGKNYSILEVSKLVAASVSYPGYAEFIPLRKAEANDMLANNTRAANFLGWHPTRALDWEVLKLAQYYRKKWIREKY